MFIKSSRLIALVATMFAVVCFSGASVLWAAEMEVDGGLIVQPPDDSELIILDGEANSAVLMGRETVREENGVPYFLDVDGKTYI